MSASTTSLPIEEVLPALQEQLTTYDEVVLVAPPGAGKTTRVPLAILNSPWLQQQKILLVEPRRLATLSSAHFLAHSLGETCGNTVGYRMRLDTKSGPKTRLEVITHGVLLSILQSDPSLEGVGAVIFDEFHERSLDSDLSLAMCIQGRELLREELPLKLIVMSATMDAQSVSQLLGNAPIIVSEGRQFPVRTHHLGPAPNRYQLQDQLHEAIAQAMVNHSGSILVFLPGQGEIRQALEHLSPLSNPHVELLPLFGDLSMEQQRQAIAPTKPGHRKIVLATNIAETSLTIDGIECVIDAGLSRQMIYDTRTGLSRLTTVKVSRAAATQRAGRAGRLSAGSCYRLWSESEHQSLAPQATVEIKQADLSALCLQLYAFGCADTSDLKWLDPPPKGPFRKAQRLLLSLGALSATGSSDSTGETQFALTTHGQRLSQISLSPRLGHLLLVAQQHQQLTLGCHIAALLSEKDPLLKTHGQDHDLMHRLAWLKGQLDCHPTQHALRQRIRQQSKRLHQQMPPTAELRYNAVEQAPFTQAELVAVFIALAWPERIAQQTSTAKLYKLANGKRVSSQQSVNRDIWLAVASTIGFDTKQGNDQQRICLAVALPEKLFKGPLNELVTTQVGLTWQTEHERIVAFEKTAIGQLTLHQKRATKVNPQQRRQIICERLAQDNMELLNWTPELRLWQARVQLLHDSYTGSATNPWPDLSDTTLTATLSTWLGPYLERVNNKQDLKRLDLTSILSNLLPWPLPKQLQELAPSKFKVPSGNAHIIDYSHNPPVLAVKLQELFGMQKAPMIGYSTALQVHLLSPRGSVLQVTQDLAHFWQTSYTEVKKEMKGRYPKHPWPDDPTQALATAKTNRALRKS